MKRQAILLVALVFALSLTGTAAAADAPAPPIMLEALFTEPSGGCAADASAAAPGSPADAIFLQTGCTAQHDCGGHGSAPISCQGSGSGPFGSSCSVGLCSVTCDSQTTYCCDISQLACPHRACVYCACIAEGFSSPSECSDQACGIHPD